MKGLLGLTVVCLLGSMVGCAAPALPVAKGLVLDLNADVGVTVEDESMVTSWTNQASSPKALDFKITEEGRTKTIISQEELGTGRPTLKANEAEINGHNSLCLEKMN